MPVKKSWSCWWLEGSGHYTTACTFTGSDFRFPCSMMWPQKVTEFTWNSHFSPSQKAYFPRSEGGFASREPDVQQLPLKKKKIPCYHRGRWRADDACREWFSYVFVHSFTLGWERLNKQLEGSGAPAQWDRSGVSDYLTFLGGEAGGVASHRQFKCWSVIWINNERTTKRNNVFVYLQNQNLIFNHF